MKMTEREVRIAFIGFLSSFAACTIVRLVVMLL